MNTLTPREQTIQAEAVYSFAAKITAGPTIVGGSSHGAAVWVDAVSEFLASRGNLANPYPTNAVEPFGNSVYITNTRDANVDVSSCVFKNMTTSLTVPVEEEGVYEQDIVVQRSASFTKVPEAMATLRKAMQDDHDYAWTWQCNLAMMVKDAGGCSHKEANDAAMGFMRLCFDFDGRKSELFQERIKGW